MFATNLILILAFVAMIVGFIWLFRDGEGPARGPAVLQEPEDDDAPAVPRVERDDSARD